MPVAAVAPARAAAFELLTREASSSGAFDLAAAAADVFAGLDRRDRALAYELATGTLKRRRTLDQVIAACADVAPGRIRPAVREALRLATFQILYLDRVPAHAAVSDSVELAKRSGRRDGAFANAVLRRVAAGGAAALARLTEGDSAAALAARHAHPEWLVSLWRRELGPETAEALLAADNLPAERCVRVNRLRATPQQAIAALAADGIEARAAEQPSATERHARRDGPASASDGHARPAGHVAEAGDAPAWPDALLLEGAALEGAAALRDGLVTPQSRASQLAAAVAVEALDPAADGAFADLCAAPGVKTSQIAAALPGWRVVAIDDDPQRAAGLRANLGRLGADAVQVVERDVLELGADAGEHGRYLGALLDAPCSGLGTLASRPDLRWRRRPADLGRLAALQQRLLAAAAALVAPGGMLTYSVCTIARVETLDVVERFLAGEPDGAVWTVDDLGAGRPALRHPANGAFVQTLPSRDGTSGFFVARLRRVE